jgi:RHS repeat-associated protein
MESTQPILRCRYSFDPLDRLISQLQPDVPAHQRFYCKSRLATEIQGAIGHSIIQHDDWLLAQQQRQGDSLDTTLLATDIQRSVLHTLKANHQRQPIAYSPYGHRRAVSGLSSLLGFNGERPDPVTGHYLLGNGYRAFNPVLMRFNSPDSLSPFGFGGLNSYAYCLGDPVNRGDPSGHISSFITSAMKSWLARAKTAIATPLELTLGSTRTTVKTLPGVSRGSAIKTIEKIKKLTNKKSPISIQNAFYQNALATEHKSHNNSITIQSITAHTFPSLQHLDGLPSGYKKIFRTHFYTPKRDLLEYIKADPEPFHEPVTRQLSMRKLHNVMHGNSVPPARDFKPPTQDQANNFQIELDAFQSRRLEELSSKIRAIRNKHFIN